MKSEIKLSIVRDGAEVIIGEKSNVISDDDLVRTSAGDQVRKAVDSVVVGLGDIAGIVLDVFETFAKEAALRKLKEHGKLTVSFGISGGGNVDLKLVGAKADAFMTIQLEFATPSNANGLETKAVKNDNNHGDVDLEVIKQG